MNDEFIKEAMGNVLVFVVLSFFLVCAMSEIARVSYDPYNPVVMENVPDISLEAVRTAQVQADNTDEMILLTEQYFENEWNVESLSNIFAGVSVSTEYDTSIAKDDSTFTYYKEFINESTTESLYVVIHLRVDFIFDSNDVYVTTRIGL